MAEQSTQSVVVKASADQVMAVIANFADYPSWAKSVKRAEVVEASADGYGSRVHFVLDAGPIQDDYTLAYDWAADRTRVSWTLVEPSSAQKKQHGSYTLAESGDTTTVTYALTVETVMPMLGLLRRKAEKMIMNTALRELKKRVER